MEYKHYLEKGNIEKALVVMKNNGFSIIDCIKELRNVMDISLGEAKTMVSQSNSWKNESEIASQLHEEILKVMEENKNSNK